MKENTHEFKVFWSVHMHLVTLVSAPEFDGNVLLSWNLLWYGFFQRQMMCQLNCIQEMHVGNGKRCTVHSTLILHWW